MVERASSAFESGRANLRDTAKWMVSGIVGVAALIIGASTISQLGAMDLVGGRFWCAVIALLLAASLCWIPFARALAVLRSEVTSLNQFVTASAGEYKEAADRITEQLGSTFPGEKTLRDFVSTFRHARDAAWAAAPNKADAEKAVADLDSRFQIARDACISQLVAIRFERLVQAMKFPGILILISFLVFSWAANPPKGSIKVFDKPYLETLTPENISTLKAANLGAACYGSGVQLIMIAGPEAGPQTGVLTGPGCRPHKITLSAHRIVMID
jgi:hypothetical protein